MLFRLQSCKINQSIIFLVMSPGMLVKYVVISKQLKRRQSTQQQLASVLSPFRFGCYIELCEGIFNLASRIITPVLATQ